ncbi:MAG: ABC transporter permease [Chloroflexaceae bacterium]|nr:ABC transporter permease [Chloroflexaceae bacterium]
MGKQAAPLSPSGRRTRSVAGSSGWPWRALVSRQEIVILACLVVAALVIGLWNPNFYQATNLLNLARGVSWFAVAALGVSMVILVGGIDLSVGAVMALAGVLCASAMQAGLPVALAIIVGLLGGLSVGLLNGLLVARLGLPPFIVTLGTMGLTRGVTVGMTNGAPLRDLPPHFRALGQSDLHLGPLSVPLSLIVMALLALLVSLLLDRTVLGRYIYTVGRDEQVLRLVGVPTASVKITVYALSGMLAACSGVLMTAWLGVAAPTAAEGYELEIIAAAVIGGASLLGGEGRVPGVVLGTTLMLVVRNGFVFLGLPTYLQSGAIGAMILTVVLIDHVWRKRLTQG